MLEKDLKNMTSEEIIKKYGAFEENTVSIAEIEEEEKRGKKDE